MVVDHLWAPVSAMGQEALSPGQRTGEREDPSVRKPKAGGTTTVYPTYPAKKKGVERATYGEKEKRNGMANKRGLSAKRRGKDIYLTIERRRGREQTNLPPLAGPRKESRPYIMRSSRDAKLF